MPDQCSRWIAVCVDMLDHPQLGGEYDRRSAWLWLIANAAWKDHRVRMGNSMVEVKRGQVVIGRDHLAKKWGWGTKKVRLFLDFLGQEKMIENGQSKGRLANVATICNYDKYQTAAPVEGPVEGPVQGRLKGRFRAGSGPHSTRDTIIKKDLLSETSSDDMQHEPPKTAAKGSRKRQPYPADFEAWWSAYPDRTNNSKSKAAAEWAKLADDERLAAMASLKTFSAYCKANRDYRCVHAERYLRDRRFEAHVEAPAAKTGGPWWRDPAQLAQMTPDRWRKGISEFANGIWPTDKLGPPPRHAGCVVPKALVDELKLAETYDEYGCNKHGH